MHPLSPADCLNNVIWILIKEAFRVRYLHLYSYFFVVLVCDILYVSDVKKSEVTGIPVQVPNLWGKKKKVNGLMGNTQI